MRKKHHKPISHSPCCHRSKGPLPLGFYIYVLKINPSKAGNLGIIKYKGSHIIVDRETQSAS